MSEINLPSIFARLFCDQEFISDVGSFVTLEHSVALNQMTTEGRKAYEIQKRDYQETIRGYVQAYLGHQKILLEAAVKKMSASKDKNSVIESIANGVVKDCPGIKAPASVRLTDAAKLVLETLGVEGVSLK